MTPKQRIQATLARQPVDRPPVDLWHTAEVAASLRAHLGVEDNLSVYRALDIDKIIWVAMDYRTATGDKAFTLTGEAGKRTAWGVLLKDVQAGEAHYAEFGEAPLAAYDSVEAIADYPWWPDVERFDYADATRQAEAATEAGFAVIGPWVSLFEVYCQLRGLEQAMVDLFEDPDLVDGILDRIESIQTEMMKRYFATAAKSLDLVFVSDDIAGQQSLLMSPASWQRHLQPRLKRWCDLIHDHGLKVLYHTDGAARKLLGPIIDCGVDVLNPIQHACPGMDMGELKAEFGDRVIFHGGVDNQTVLPRGTPEDVRAEVQLCRRTLGAGGQGYICCSCHNTQAGTPVENILAMVDEAKRG